MKKNIVKRQINRENCYLRTDFEGATAVFNDEKNGLCVMLCVEIIDKETSELVKLHLPWNAGSGAPGSRYLKIGGMAELDNPDWSFSDATSFVNFVYDFTFDPLGLKDSFPELYAIIWDAIEKEGGEYCIDVEDKKIVRNIDA